MCIAQKRRGLNSLIRAMGEICSKCNALVAAFCHLWLHGDLEHYPGLLRHSIQRSVASYCNLLLGDKEILAFFIEILHVCWAPWISQVRALGFLFLVTSIFLDKGRTCIFILTLKDPEYCSG